MPLAVLVSAVALGCGRPTSDQPNVLVVVVDTLRADHLPFYGGEAKNAPFLNEWAARSIVFERAWSTSSWTAPAVASLFTGVYPFQHGVHLGLKAFEFLSRGGGELELDRVPDPLETLPELFQSSGYRTFGLSDNPNVSEAQGFAAGFDRFESFSYAGANRVNAVLASWESEIAEAEPWFVYLHYMDPHQPYHVRRPWHRPPTATDRYSVDGAAYDSEIGWVDAHLRTAFERLGVDGSTLIVFTADHGEEFGEHGSNSHRFKLYSELTRIPLVLHHPGVAPRRVRTNVSLVDLLPTLRSILGLPPSEQDAGVDLTAFYAKAGEVPIDRVLFASRTTGMAWKRSVIRGRYKLIETRPGGTELYDLDSDPGERRNLVDERGELSEELLRFSRDFRTSAPKWDGVRTTVELSPEDLRRLEELGYVDEGG
ncbi:MAG: sulfatase [Deltaproteobacteria bacterium]|nr:sulfatase [Deltaproteobacteria bacterium]